MAAKLGDGSRIDVERMQRFKVHAQASARLRVELLLEGLNPMAERGNVYLALSQCRTRLRAKADEEGAVGAEIVAAFEPRSRRYAVRDQLGLWFRVPGGAWPPCRRSTTRSPASRRIIRCLGSRCSFRGADRGPFDLILNELLGDAPSPPVARAARAFEALAYAGGR
ncbi:MAG: hypothetical protein U1E87_02795 [Alphaproteobacteria bacterium]